MIHPPEVCTKLNIKKKPSDSCKNWASPLIGKTTYYKFVGRMVCGGCKEWKPNKEPSRPEGHYDIC